MAPRRAMTAGKSVFISSAAFIGPERLVFQGLLAAVPHELRVVGRVDDGRCGAPEHDAAEADRRFLAIRPAQGRVVAAGTGARPLPDRRGSKNRALPSSTRAGVLTLSLGMGTAGRRHAWSAAVGGGTLSVAAATAAAASRAAVVQDRTRAIEDMRISWWSARGGRDASCHCRGRMLQIATNLCGFHLPLRQWPPPFVRGNGRTLGVTT
jgi:hypothetical protein